MIVKEVLVMITLVSPNQATQAGFAMSATGCVDAAWRRALPKFMGEVSAHDYVIGTDVTTPGHPTWRPPTEE